MIRLKEILECIKSEKMKITHLLGEEIVRNSNLTDLSLLMIALQSIKWTQRVRIQLML